MHSQGFQGTVRHSASESAPYTVVAMYTADVNGLAERLLASLRALSLPHLLYEVPSVHRSISLRGSDDPAYTKSSLIRHALATLGHPVLYVDADVVFRAAPVRIDALCRAGTEFAIYNWLADECTDCYKPVVVAGFPPGRFYGYSHSIDVYAPEQLICSGATQFWSPAAASLSLLERWAAAIAEFPGCADDECLDFAYNNSGTHPMPRAAWFDKAYARYAWWPHVAPVIDHPQFPSTATRPRIAAGDGRERVYAQRGELRRAARAIPRDCIVDIVARRLLRPRPPVPGKASVDIEDIGPVDADFHPAPPG